MTHIHSAKVKDNNLEQKKRQDSDSGDSGKEPQRKFKYRTFDEELLSANATEAVKALYLAEDTNEPLPSTNKDTLDSISGNESQRKIQFLTFDDDEIGAIADKNAKALYSTGDEWDDTKPEDFGIGTEEEKQYRASTKETLDSIYDGQKKMADSSSKPVRREPPKLDWNRVNKDVGDMLAGTDATTRDTKENDQRKSGCNRCRKIRLSDLKEHNRTMEVILKGMDDNAHMLAQMAKERSVLIESNALLRENNRLLKENLELKEEGVRNQS